MQTFEFEFETPYSWLLVPLGVKPSNSFVTVGDEEFHAKFGRWELRTPLSNIVGYQRSGDYKWYKAIGIRGSWVDHGITFGSSTRQGVCLKFADPIKAFIPGMKPHPGLTITVADADGLVAALESAGVRST
ncbi:MAG: hypothetical protein HKN91_15500 [Acidimicrobiia bacterium]|nr:hypothetical protein [Acidimicrobiia bacterium]